VEPSKLIEAAVCTNSQFAGGIGEMFSDAAGCPWAHAEPANRIAPVKVIHFMTPLLKGPLGQHFGESKSAGSDPNPSCTIIAFQAKICARATVNLGVLGFCLETPR
jgi:hypothetical protein